MAYFFNFIKKLYKSEKWPESINHQYSKVQNYNIFLLVF